MSEPSPIANTPDLAAVHSSRLWAAFHLNITRLLFPATMSADAIGVSTSNVYFWLTPWQRIDEHLPLSHITEVTHVRGFFWDAISVESSGGLNPLRVFGVPKPDDCSSNICARGSMKWRPRRRCSRSGEMLFPLPLEGEANFCITPPPLPSRR